jgi:hypothetical protein
MQKRSVSDRSDGRHEPEDEVPAEAADTTLTARASVPFMITRRMKDALLALGVTCEQIANMTPTQAHETITQSRLAEPEFVRVGTAKAGTPCAQCGMPGGTDTRPVNYVTWTRIVGCAPAPLHLICAPRWFGRSQTDVKPDTVIARRGAASTCLIPTAA